MSASPVDLSSIARDVLDSLLEGCQVIGFDWTYLYVNRAVASQANSTPEQLLGRTMMECFPGIDATPMFAELRRCMQERKHHRMENEFTFPDGSQGWFELVFIPVPRGTCILSVDLTEKKRAEAHLARIEDQLRHAQKMEAIGRLAGSVAHDFNNVLSVVLSYAALGREAVQPDEPLHREFSEIEKAAEHARQLTSQLLAISRKQPSKPQSFDLAESLARMDDMLRRVLGADVELRIVAAPSVGRIQADPGQIEQIILNLAINARDAMPSGGKLTIEVARVELDDSYAREHLGTAPGAHVMLAVSDTGIGMDKATQARIFEPFFTTKPAEQGTGLGLSTVFGIVEQSGGSIWVYSEPGKGTTFKLYFPLTTASTPSADVRQAPAAASNGQGTILLVDDHDQIRALAANILKRRGYTIIAAATPAEAMELCSQHQGRIDVLLTDITMPGMSGQQLAERVRAQRPELKVLYMSGYANDAVQHHGVLHDDAAFVSKPFTPDSLTNAVKAVLSPTHGA